MEGARILVVDDSSTIRQVVELVLTKAGYSVVLACDGADALEVLQRDRFDLVLLDFVMPRINGHQFCQRVGADPRHSEMPIVLMSARGDQIGDRFVQLNGVVDYITKPFSPESLLAVVDGALRKGAGASRSLTMAPTEPSEEQLELIRSQISERLAQKGLLAPDADAETLALALTEDFLVDLARSTLVGMGNALALYGVVGMVPLAEVLQMLALQTQTGILTVRNRQQVVRMVFRDGKVLIALAKGLKREHAFGQIVLRRDLVNERELSQILTNKRGGGTIGDKLVQAGIITEPQRKELLETQTCEIVYEILRWSYGTFEFEVMDQLPEQAMHSQFSLGVQRLVMEGLRRVDEWHLMEKDIGNFDQVFIANSVDVDSWADTPLTEEEKLVLQQIDGEMSLRDIISALPYASFDVASIVHRFLTTKLIRKVSASS